MAIYMKCDPVIAGDVTLENYVNWIYLTSLTWGVNREVGSADGKESEGAKMGKAGSTTQSSAATKKAPKPQIQEFTINKRIDVATIGLLEYTLSSSRALKEVKFVFVSHTVAGNVGKAMPGDDAATYANIVLQNVLVTSYQLQAAEGDQPPSETFTLQPTIIQIKYVMRTGVDAPNAPLRLMYDLSQGTVSTPK